MQFHSVPTFDFFQGRSRSYILLYPQGNSHMKYQCSKSSGSKTLANDIVFHTHASTTYWGGVGEYSVFTEI